MAAGKILVVDDDSNLLEVIRMRLESAKYDVVAASEEKGALESVKTQLFDVSILDLQLDSTDGISLMEKVHQVNPDIPVIILTAYGSIESAVEAMQRGAYSYLTKPFDPRELLFQIKNAMESSRLLLEITRLKRILEEKYDFGNIIAKSEKMQKVLDVVTRIAGTDSTVYIHGESGTGKELVAKAIHVGSERKDRPFVAVNCAALPDTLLESELFGYEKGAFTGAVHSKEGLFTQAHEGTIFLDEIGDMPLALQGKILRVLQERQFYPLGSKKPLEVDVRVIAATNKDLQREVKEGNFREDLYYRIHVIPIKLPPLRERREDIATLVDHFLAEFNQKMRIMVKGLTPQAMQKLLLHDWPGNVRELKNTIEFAMAMTRDNVIAEDLILQTKGVVSEQVKSLKEARDSFEKNYLINILEVTQGNVSKAAEMAGKYRADLYNLLKKHSLSPEKFKKA
jgi:two-component system response regulator GlrR